MEVKCTSWASICSRIKRKPVPTYGAEKIKDINNLVITCELRVYC